ncbi:MAG TPA: hypothetical protein VN437_07375 [Rectinemataceae bacterium]|nr:hypothetical protein [Rectinemataceae bacterium]
MDIVNSELLSRGISLLLTEAYAGPSGEAARHFGALRQGLGLIETPAPKETM